MYRSKVTNGYLRILSLINDNIYFFFYFCILFVCVCPFNEKRLQRHVEASWKLSWREQQCT